MGVLTMVCGVMLLFAAEVFLMAYSQQLMPLMEESIGKTSVEIMDYSPELMSFMFTPIKAMSALLFTLSVGILIMLYGPFRKGQKWASFTIFPMLILWLTSAIVIYLGQPGAPWPVWLILLILVFIALILDYTNQKSGLELIKEGPYA